MRSMVGVLSWSWRSLLVVAGAVLAFGLSPTSAQAQGTCTGSGSLGPKLFEPGTAVTACPNLANPCEVGDVVEYRITAQNTSSDAGGLFADGVLGGDTCRVAPDPLAGSCSASAKACAVDADCTLTVDVMLTNPPRPGTFVFDAGTDCTTLPNTSAVVDSCVAVGANIVRVTIKGGVSAPAPANTPVPLVEFRAVATTPITNPVFGQFGVNASAVIPAGGLFPAVGVTADTDCDPQEGWSATGNTSGFFPPVCEVEVDKQVSCDGGVTWVDSDALTGNNVFVTMNEDGTNADNANLPCFGWNGEDVDGDGTPDSPGEEVLVRYRARNSGNLALTSCTLMDSNVQIPAVTFPNAGAIALAGMTDFFGPTNLLCAPSLNAGEPDRAEASCTCTGDLGPIDSNTAFDDANFQCLTPSLQVQKACEDENPVNNQDDTVRITVTNAGTADLVGCTVTDTLDLDEGQLDPACNAATQVVGDGFTPGPTQNVPVTPAMFDLPMMTAQPVSGTFAELTQNACNKVAVTCTVDGTTKTVSAEDEDSCLGFQEPPKPCRITAGGIAPDAGIDLGAFADIRKATFGGQVGAPCGCIGCFDDLDHVQGQWTHNRHQRKGRFHAADYASLVCDLDEGEGPEPRPAPANKACFTGVGKLAESAGKRNQRVAFRVEVEDRGEPAAGSNFGAQEDVYRIRIWSLVDQNEQAVLDGICCLSPTVSQNLPDPIIDDGDNLVHGNIQIHPVTPLTDRGFCPPPPREPNTCEDGL